MQKLISILSLIAVMSGTVGQTISPFSQKYGQIVAAIGGIALVVTDPLVKINQLLKGLKSDKPTQK